MRASRWLSAGSVLATTLLAACDLAPPYTPPATTPPADYKEARDWTTAEPKDELPRGNWWELFRDPGLNALEAQVTAANQDLKAAVARYDEARADAKTAQADYYPTIDASGSVSRNHVSQRIGNPLPRSTFNNFSLGLDFSYEI